MAEHAVLRVIVDNGDWDDYRSVDEKALEELRLPEDKKNILYDSAEKLASACALFLVTFSGHTALLYRRNPGYKPSTDFRTFVIVVRGEDKVYRKTGMLTLYENQTGNIWLRPHSD